MNRMRYWGFLPAICLLALPSIVEAQNSIKLGTAQAKVGTTADVPVTLSTTAQVQGLVVAVDWDGLQVSGEALTAGPALATANTVVRRVEPSYAVLGVVMDNDGVGDEVINPGNDQVLATLTLKGLALGTTALTFRDAAYATVDGGPLLDNIVVVGGLSIGSAEGLGTTPGSFETVVGFNRYYIDSANANNGDQRCGDAKVLMENIAAVEGYVVSLCHGPDLTLDSISVGAAATAQGADFSASEIFASGGTLGVVIDLEAPFTNNMIPAGDANHIASFRYCCTPPTTGQVETPLTFCDNVLGDPVKENVMVIGGLSVSPRLENGTFTCKATRIPPENCNNGIDDDGDGFVDAADSDCQQTFACGSHTQAADGTPGPLQASIATTLDVCFYVKSPEDNQGGHAQFDHIQGFSMALTYCCDVVAHETLDVTGTIVEAIGAEFVTVQADNTPDDGDGCELIIGVLVDALPPFDGQTIPPLDNLQLVGCVKFDVKDDPALCQTVCPIKFTDGVNGRGKVPVKNLISVENVSRGPQLRDCEIKIVDKERFYRGDCNFSRMGSMSVDIADAASVVSFLFLPGTWKFNPPCLDACDCNDDGRIDLADAVCILQYLFQFGRFPPAPGPGLRATGNPNPNMVEPSPAGVDPSDDKLDCKAGTDCAA